MEPYRTETVETEAGEYTIERYYDEHAEQPYNDGLGFAFITDRNQVDVLTGDHSSDVASLINYHRRENAYNGNIYDHEIRSAAAIARYLQLKYGFKGIRQVDDDYTTSEPSADRDENFGGLAWAPDDAADPASYTDSGIAEYRAWAKGECYGYMVLDPDGGDVDDCWGFYGDIGEKYMLEEARENIAHDVEQRVAAAALAAEQASISASLVGSGFVGLI